MQLALQEVALHIGPGIVLQPPRLSGEHDVDAVLQATAMRSGRVDRIGDARGAAVPLRSHHRSLRRSPRRPRPVGAPIEPTVVARPRRRFPRLAAAVALGTAVAGGAFVHVRGQQRLRAAGETQAAELPATSSTPAPIQASSTAVPNPPPAMDDPDPVPAPSADEAAPSIVAADAGPEKAKKARRRSLRRLSQTVRRAPAAPSSSITDDDLWDRRH